MGSFSLLLRAPVVALSDSLGGDRLLGYQLGALVCFIPALILGGWLAREIQAQGRSRLEATVFGVLVVINPITLDAVHMGHPEEVLGGALSVLAVVCAARGRSMLAAVVLGLAIGTKQWALLALLPALFVAPAGARLRMGAVAAAIGITLALSAPLADWHDYREKAHTLGRSTTVSHYSAWTGVSRPVDIVVPGFDGPVTIHRLPGGLSREDISLMIPVACTILVLAFAQATALAADGGGCSRAAGDFLLAARHTRQHRAPLLLRADGACARMVGGTSAWDSTRNRGGQCVHLATVSRNQQPAGNAQLRALHVRSCGYLALRLAHAVRANESRRGLTTPPFPASGRWSMCRA